MQSNQAATQRGNAVALMVLAGIELVVCEVDLLTRLWRKGWGHTGMDGYVTPYLMPIMVTFPLIAALAQRKRLRKFQDDGDMTSIATAQIGLDTGLLLIVTYGIILMLTSIK